MTIETIIKLSDVLDLKPEINLIPKVENYEAMFYYNELPFSGMINFAYSTRTPVTATGAAEYQMCPQFVCDNEGNEYIKEVAV